LCKFIQASLKCTKLRSLDEKGTVDGASLMLKFMFTLLERD
jgi:hypothetical protein